jgi:RNA polymerase sigma-70 factor, ECF subfamily
VTAGGRRFQQSVDAGRFEAFVREYQDMVFATAVRLLGQSTDAEDVAQSVFLRAFERFEEIASSETVAGWLKTVTRNLSLNHLARYRARWQFFSELEGPDGSMRTSVLGALSVAPSAPDSMEREEVTNGVERALRSLPDHQRVPLVLFHFEDMSYQEIASTLGVSLSKVKTDIHRGRERLRDEMGYLDEHR